MKRKDYGRRFPMRPIPARININVAAGPSPVDVGKAVAKVLNGLPPYGTASSITRYDAPEDPDDITAAMWPWTLESIAAHDADEDEQ